MSAALAEETPRRKRRRSRSWVDRVQVILKPYIRMRLDPMAAEAGMSTPLFARELILEAMEARGYPRQKLLADWHVAMSEAALNDERHPYALDGHEEDDDE